jgi:hypothetical protein
MTTFILDLNDADLRIGEADNVVTRSTGYALLDQDQLLLGDAALRQFRLHPRQANNLYWHRLNTEALSHRGRDIANHADLVFRHLQRMAEAARITASDELIIAAPATTTTDQLGLLLGIAQQLGIKVTGIVDAAVAATANSEMPARFSYIDVSLHRLSVTRIEGGDALNRTGWQDVSELSLAGLLDAWVNVIADRFVRETRFDPLANAATEQQVYNQLFDWVTSAAQAPELGIEVQHGTNPRRIDLPASVLTDKAITRYRLAEKILDSEGLVLSHRAAALPGFHAWLCTHASGLTVCDPDAVFSGVTAHLSAIRSAGDAIRFVTRLPSVGTRPAAKRAAPQTPTHVLFGGRAIAIGAGVTLDHDLFPELPARYPDGAIGVAPVQGNVRLSIAPGITAAVDGAPARDGASVRIGSAIEVAGARVLLIEVDGGP